MNAMDEKNRLLGSAGPPIASHDPPPSLVRMIVGLAENPGFVKWPPSATPYFWSRNAIEKSPLLAFGARPAASPASPVSPAPSHRRTRATLPPPVTNPIFSWPPNAIHESLPPNDP